MNLETLSARLRLDASGFGSGIDAAQRRLGGLKATFASFAGNLGSDLFQNAASGLLDMAGGFLMANANAETMRNSLNIAIGDVDEAGKTFKELQQFAANTPFEFPELMDSAVRLEAFGVDAMSVMTQLGDTAAAQGRDLGQITSAYLDAGMGQYVRLQELGVDVADLGDEVRLRWFENGQMMEKTVADTGQAVQAELLGIWDRYDGAMATQSKTFKGQLSTLKDNWNLLIQDASMGMFQFAKSGLGAANTFFGEFGRLREKGLGPLPAAFEAVRDTVTKTFGQKTAKSINKFVSGLERGLGVAASVVGKVAGVIGDALGKAIGFVADHFGFIGPVVAGVAAVFGTFAAVSAVVGAVVAGLGVALAVLLSPIALVAGAVALLVYAWQNDFLGVATRVKEFVGDLTAVFKRLTGEGVSPVEAAIRALGSAFESLTGLEVSAFFKDIADAMGALLDGDWSGFADNIRSAFAGIDWGALVEGARNLGAELLSRLGEIGADILVWAQGQFDAVDWPAVWANIVDVGRGILEKLGEVTADVLLWAQGQFTAVDWAAVWSGIVDIGKGVVGALGTVFGEIQSWAGEQVKLIDWGAVWSGVTDAGAAVVTSLGTVFGEMQSWAGEQVKQIDWGAVWSGVVDAGKGVASRLGDVFGEATSWAGEQVKQIDWAAVWAGLVDVGKGLAGRLGAVTTEIATWAGEQILAVDWPAAWSGLIDAGKSLVGRLGTIAGEVTSWAGEQFKQIDWTAAWSGVTDAGGQLVAGLGEIAGEVTSWAGEQFKQIDWVAAWSGIVDAGSGLVGRLGDIASDVAAWVGTEIANAAGFFTSVDWGSIPGTIVNGLWTAITGAAGAIDWANAGGIISKIYDSLVAGVGSIDWGGIPGQIVDSLWNAMKGAAGQLNPLDLFTGGGGDEEGGGASGSALFGGGTPDRSDFAKMIENRMAGVDFTPIINRANEAAAQITNVTLAIEARVQAMATNLTVMAGNAASGFNNLFKLDPAVSHAGAVQQSLDSIFSGIASNATVMGGNAGTGYTNTFRPALNQSVPAAGAVQTALGNIFSGIATTATRMGQNAASGFLNTFRQIQQAQGIAASVANAVANAFAFLPARLYSYGQNAGASFAQGLASQVGAANAAASQLAAAADRAVAARLRIGSPSRVMLDHANNTVAGFLLPLERRQGEVAAAMAALVAPPRMPSSSLWGVGGMAGSALDLEALRPIHQHVYQVLPEELVTLMRDARDGASFAHGVGPEMGRKYGE